jgi:hypothetical protein
MRTPLLNLDLRNLFVYDSHLSPFGRKNPTLSYPKVKKHLGNKVGISVEKDFQNYVIFDLHKLLIECRDVQYETRQWLIGMPIGEFQKVPTIKQKLRVVNGKFFGEALSSLEKNEYVVTGDVVDTRILTRTAKLSERGGFQPLRKVSYYPSVLGMRLETAISLFNLSEQNHKENFEEIVQIQKPQIKTSNPQVCSLDDLFIEKEKVLIFDNTHVNGTFRSQVYSGSQLVGERDDLYGIHIDSKYIIIDVQKFNQLSGQSLEVLDRTLGVGSNIIEMENQSTIRKYCAGTFTQKPNDFKDPFLMYFPKEKNRPLLVIPSRK